MRYIIILSCILVIGGCSTISPPKNQVIAIDKKGDPVNPESREVLNKSAYKQYINKVLRTSEDKIIVFIHGGLNTPDFSNNRAKTLSYAMKQDKYHSVFIHWRSGFFTTYWDHLMFQRQGDRWPIMGPLTSPFVLIEDLARGVSRLPMIWTHKINSYFKGATFDSCDTYYPSEKNAVNLGCNYLNSHLFGDISVPTHNNYPLNSGKNMKWDERTGMEKFGDNFLSGVELLSGLVTAPIFDAGGTGSWDVMKTRTEIMFSKPKPKKISSYFNGTPKKVRSYTNYREGALTTFLKKLAVTAKDKEIILIGHSMGAIVANNILIQHPEISFSKIIYLAAACSIKDFQSAVVPYLKKNSNTKFFNYMLHPVAENHESHGYGIGGTGSLLNQIDNFYENAVFENQRTLGRWVNVMNGINYFDVDHIQKQVYLRVMPLNEDYPTTHGDFSKVGFLKKGKEFWTDNFGK